MSVPGPPSNCYIMDSLRRGAFIVVEGVDRSGKSTQCRKLAQSLVAKGIQAEYMSFPDRSTPVGRIISEYLSNKNYKLNDKAIHLLFSANRWENMDKMHNKLLKGTTLIVDRYSYSGIAFSAIKNNMDINWCKAPENGLLKPDLVLLLTLSSNELETRPGFGDERYENATTQQKVASIFQQMSEEYDNFKVASASGTVDEVHQNLLESVLDQVKEVGTKPLECIDFSSKHYKCDVNNR